MTAPAVAAKPAFTLTDLIPSQDREVIFPPFHELTMLIYGDQGTGKTSFFGRSKHAFILATEPGAQFQNTSARRIERWAPDKAGKDKRLDFVTMVNALVAGQADGSNRAKGIMLAVVDTVDRLHQMCTAQICEENGVAQIGDIPYGKGYSLVTDSIKAELRRLAAVIPVACTSHALTVTEELENKTGIKKEVEKRKPSVDRRVAEWLAGEQNLVGYTYKSTDGDFLIKFHSDARLETKDRTGLLEAARKPIKTEWAAVVAAYGEAAKAAGVVLKSRFQ